MTLGYSDRWRLTMILVEITATGDMDTCDSYIIGHVFAPAELTTEKQVLSRLKQLNRDWLNSDDYNPDGQDEDFVTWLVDENGFHYSAKRKASTVEYQMKGSSGNTRYLARAIPENTIKLTGEAADKIAEILSLWNESVEVSAVFDSDNELADDGGNVYVVELSEGVYLTASKA
jgi:hypothetical protein